MITNGIAPRTSVYPGPEAGEIDDGKLFHTTLKASSGENWSSNSRAAEKLHLGENSAK